jgi:hypothetical protein
MVYRPSSKILILAICSLNKQPGGAGEYAMQDSIASRLPVDITDGLIKTRRRIKQEIIQANTIDWQGVRVAELAFNRNLLDGPDFGGHEGSAQYLPALYRYDGRFFQTLGEDGKHKVSLSKHHVLFLSGLYGLLMPMEPIQLYSCPLKPRVAELWTGENILTRVCVSYLRAHGITRVVDLTALAAYRNLINWAVVSKETKVKVLHCFFDMAAGADALIPFGHLAKNFLLEASEEELLNLEPETRRDGILFREVQVTLPGLPEELQVIQLAERELRLLESYPVELASEVLSGGQPRESRRVSSLPPTRETASPSRAEDWLFAMTSQFRRATARLDRRL